MDREEPPSPWKCVLSPSFIHSSYLLPPSSGVLGELADDAFIALSEQVPQEVDIANFVLDLRELGSLIPTLQENLAKTVSGGYLSYKFGWEPMLGDISKLSRISDIVADRLAWLRRTRGKRVRIGYFKKLEGSEFPSASQYPLTNGRTQWTFNSFRGEFRASGTLYHELQGLEGMEGTLRGMVAALGLNNPSAIVWERIPFSFVVDWLARTQHITNSFTVQPFAGVWNVTHVTHSIMQELSLTQWYTEGVDFRHHEQGTLTVKRYQRGIGLPVSSAMFYGRELTPQQARLSAALIAGAAR
jgi:hypothetical protein